MGISRATENLGLMICQDLRYKDYQLVCKPSICNCAHEVALRGQGRGSTLELSETNEFAEVMKQRELLEWWKQGMGFR